MPKILTEFQVKALKAIGKTELSRFFVWSGGTALSFQYLHHRLSNDLDFMSKDLFPDDYLLIQIKNIAETLKVKKIEEQKKFNRHEFWLKKNKKVLRIEFVFYPFPNIKKPKKIREFEIKIDSIEDIFTNKIHTIYERTEPKDIFDFYCILQKKKINFLKSFKWVEKKFGVEIDPVLFISRVFEGVNSLNEIKPLVFKKELLKSGKIKKFFQKQAESYLNKKM